MKIGWTVKWDAPTWSITSGAFRTQDEAQIRLRQVVDSAIQHAIDSGTAQVSLKIEHLENETD